MPEQFLFRSFFRPAVRKITDIGGKIRDQRWHNDPRNSLIFLPRLSTFKAHEQVLLQPAALLHGKAARGRQRTKRPKLVMSNQLTVTLPQISDFNVVHSSTSSTHLEPSTLSGVPVLDNSNCVR